MEEAADSEERSEQKNFDAFSQIRKESFSQIRKEPFSQIAKESLSQIVKETFVEMIFEDKKTCDGVDDQKQVTGGESQTLKKMNWMQTILDQSLSDFFFCIASLLCTWQWVSWTSRATPCPSNSNLLE